MSGALMGILVENRPAPARYADIVARGPREDRRR
jgi:hypothetical protein